MDVWGAIQADIVSDASSALQKMLGLPKYDLAILEVYLPDNREHADMAQNFAQMKRECAKQIIETEDLYNGSALESMAKIDNYFAHSAEIDSRLEQYGILRESYYAHMDHDGGIRMIENYLSSFAGRFVPEPDRVPILILTSQDIRSADLPSEILGWCQILTKPEKLENIFQAIKKLLKPDKN